MLEQTIEKVVVWMYTNILPLVIYGSLGIFVFCNEICLIVYLAMMSTLVITGKLFLEKKGYEFETEETEAYTASFYFCL